MKYIKYLLIIVLTTLAAGFTSAFVCNNFDVNTWGFGQRYFTAFAFWASISIFVMYEVAHIGD